MRNKVFEVEMTLVTPISAEDYRIKTTEIASGSSVTNLTANTGRHAQGFQDGYEVSFWKGYPQS